MKTTITSAPVTTRRSFFQKFHHEAPQKMGGLFLALLLYYFLPLAGAPSLLYTPQIILAIFACSAVYLVQPAIDTKQTESASDKNSMRAIIVATTVSQVSIMIEWAYFHPSQEWVFDVPTITGLVLIFGGLYIRTAAIYELGVHFDNTITIREKHKLIQTGTYRYVRHGSYTGAIAVGLGIGIMVSAWWGVLISVIVLGLAYGYRIRYEEKALLAYFGDEYRAYQKRTKMLIPFLL